jgi:hypothetical protein
MSTVLSSVSPAQASNTSARPSESGAPPIPDAFLAPAFEAFTAGVSEAQPPARAAIETISAGVPYSKQDLGGAR